MSDALKKAKAKYKQKVRTFTIDVFPTEQDILNKLQSVDKYSTYIKQLIRNDIENERGRD